MAYIDWGGSDEAMIRAIERYAMEVIKAVQMVAAYIATVMEAYAKEHAEWTDRTGNARQSLAGYTQDDPPPAYNAEEATPYQVDQLAEDLVAVYLSHGMSYGRNLEFVSSGKYAIIWPTIEAHLPIIEQMLHGIFRR